LGRHYRFTDSDGRGPGWGAINVDYSRLPQSLTEAIMDTLQVQTDWLKVLSKRTEQFQSSFLKKMKHR